MGDHLNLNLYHGHAYLLVTQTFHASCLCCNKCNNKLKIGDSFAFSEEDNALLCASDYSFWMHPMPSPSELQYTACIYNIARMYVHQNKQAIQMHMYCVTRRGEAVHASYLLRIRTYDGIKAQFHTRTIEAMAPTRYIHCKTQSNLSTNRLLSGAEHMGHQTLPRMGVAISQWAEPGCRFRQPVPGTVLQGTIHANIVGYPRISGPRNSVIRYSHMCPMVNQGEWAFVGGSLVVVREKCLHICIST